MSGIDPRDRIRSLLGWFALLLLLIISFQAYPLMVAATARNTTDLQAVTESGTGVVSLPLRIIRGMAGPFPWYQIAFVENAEYMPQDFLQHVLNVAMYWLTISVVSVRWRLRDSKNSLLLIWGLLFLIGIYAPGIHSAYVSIGTVLLTPIVATCGAKRIGQRILVIALLFVLANGFYFALGLTGSNNFGSVIK